MNFVFVMHFPVFFFFFFFKLIYFWLRWVFFAVRRLLVAEHGLQVRGFQQLWHTGSVAVARGLQSVGSVVVVHGLSCSTGCGIFPVGTEPVFPALAGGFLSAAPPGKSAFSCFLIERHSPSLLGAFSLVVKSKGGDIVSP